MTKFKLFDYIYWKRRANTLENKYLKELANNEPLKEKLNEANEKLISLYEKKSETDKVIKDLKVRVSDLETIVNNKKKVK